MKIFRFKYIAGAGEKYVEMFVNGESTFADYYIAHRSYGFRVSRSSGMSKIIYKDLSLAKYDLIQAYMERNS